MKRGLVLFCGAGGTSEGMRQAGIPPTIVIDNNKAALATHEANHPDTEHILADIDGLDPTTIGKVDWMSGSAPCPEFSTAKGSKADPQKGMILVNAQLRFVQECRPRWWFMENVPRVTKYLSGVDYPTIRILNAADYGVPQTRRRAFCGRYVVPRPTHAEIPTMTLDGLRLERWMSLGDALGWDGRYYNHTNAPAMNRYPERSSEDTARTLTTDGYYLSETQLGQVWARKRGMPKVGPSPLGQVRFPEDPLRPSRTVNATVTPSGREAMILGEEPTEGYPMPRSAYPSIQKVRDSALKAYGGQDSGWKPEDLAHRTYRLATPEECAILMGFPLDYIFTGSKTAHYRQIGNAVCPPVAKAIAEANMEVIE